MISNIVAVPEIDRIMLTWTEPRFFPRNYKIATSCMYPCADTAYITDKGTKAISIARKFHINNLRPGSDCTIRFTAVYNPASLDEGIIITASTLAQSESSVLLHICMKRLHFTHQY